MTPLRAPPADFSAQAIQRAVLAASSQHPAVVYPAALGILGGIGAAVFAGPALAAGAVLAGGGLAVGAFVAHYVWGRERLASRYLAKAHQALVTQREQVLTELKRALHELDSHEGLAQLDRFGEKLAAFETILGEKFRPHELTYGRFLGIAEQVYLAGTDALDSIVNALRAGATIDVDYIRKRLKALADDPATSPAEVAEVEGLQQQLAVMNRHRQRIDDALAANERALAQFDASIAALAEIRTGAGAAAVDMETAMQELARVAAQAKSYST